MITYSSAARQRARMRFMVHEVKYLGYIYYITPGTAMSCNLKRYQRYYMALVTSTEESM